MSDDIGIGVGLGTSKSGNGPKPKGRVVLSPALRRQVADLHALAVVVEHVLPHHPQASLEQLAALLTLRRVPPVRGDGPWSAMRVHHLLQRAKRASKAGAEH